MMKEKVKNELFLERDTSSGAILNTDISGYKAIRANKEQKVKREQSMQDQIDQLTKLVHSLMGEK